MKFNLTRPCRDCPFRTDKAYLTPERAEEIADSLVRSTFPCHKTVDYSDDSDGQITNNSEHCAGALIMLEHMEQPSQMMRIMERMNMYDRHKLDMSAPIHTSSADFIQAQED